MHFIQDANIINIWVNAEFFHANMIYVQGAMDTVPGANDRLSGPAAHVFIKKW